MLLVFKFSSPFRAVCSFFSPGPCAVDSLLSRASFLPFGGCRLGDLLLADCLSTLTFCPFFLRFPPPPLTLLFFPFPSLPFQSFPLRFVPSSRSLYPALCLPASPPPCPLPFLPLSRSLWLSVSLSPSVSLSLCTQSVCMSLCFCVSLSLTSAFPRPAWFPFVSRFVSFSPCLSLCLSLCHPLFLSTYFCVSVLLSFRLCLSVLCLFILLLLRL